VPVAAFTLVSPRRERASYPGVARGVVSAVGGTTACVEHARAGEQETSAEHETGGRSPLEGFFTCGGPIVAPECLGQSFQTRTATYELIVTLPELGAPNAGAPLAPPRWRFTAEGADRTAAPPEGGTVISSRRVDKGEETPRYAQVLQFIIGTNVEAGDDEQFREAAKAVGDELAVRWASVSD
jgi:hypothetical protein